jgi:hypothetical protein
MKAELNQKSKTHYTEIDLFRNMSSILSSKYQVSFIEETHLQKVVYNSQQINQAATREISDLWIIAFSPSQTRARMTFLQAKYHRAILDSMNTKFSGDYFQYELLSTRPTLSSIVGIKCNFPLDILSFSCCDSVGSYGVFFIDNNNQIDLAYCTANHLTTNSPLPAFYTSTTAPVKLDIPYSPVNQYTLCSFQTHSELISCFDIDSFTQSLINLEIGAELIPYPIILAFVKTVLKQKGTDPTVTQLLNFIDRLLPPPNIVAAGADANDNFDGLPCTLLLINTDEKGNGG